MKSIFSKAVWGELVTLVIIIAIISVFSCKKEGEITIQGRVSDPVLGKQLSGVNVILSSKKVSSGVYSSGYQQIGSAQTDANGAFSMVIKREKTDSYKFRLTKESYFENETVVHPDDLEANDYFSIMLDMNPQSSLQIRIKNTTPWDNLDHVSWQITNAGLSCYQCCNNTTHKRTGSYFDSTYTCKTTGNRNLIILISSTKNGTTVVRYDSVYCPVFQTVQHNIFY